MVIEKSKKDKLTADAGHNGFNGGEGSGGFPAPSFALPINTAKFGLWLFISAIVMMFAAFTSAYIVRHGAGDWMKFSIPQIFWFNTAVLLLSSVSAQIALSKLKKDKLLEFKIELGIALLLGLVFLIGQIVGWHNLAGQGIYLNSNPSSAFFYLLSGMHFLHIAGAIIALVYVFGKAVAGKYNSQNRLGVELCITFWHFLDILWIYLFILLNITLA